MGKLIKYEWRKQRTTRVVILISLLVGLLAFLWGILFKNDVLAAMVLLVMFSVSLLVLLYTGIESILIFNRDLRTKQSYMLWMVPRSVWEIVGAKFISAILQMLFSFAVFFAAGCLCGGALLYYSDGMKAVIEMAQIIVKNFFENGNLIDILWFVAAFVVAWIEVIMIGFLAVIISRTVLLNSKFAGLFSLILFFVINWVVERGYSLIHAIPLFKDAGSLGIWNIWDCVYYLLISAVLFLATGWLADRKLSV